MKAYVLHEGNASGDLSSTVVGVIVASSYEEAATKCKGTYKPDNGCKGGDHEECWRLSHKVYFPELRHSAPLSDRVDLSQQQRDILWEIKKYFHYQTGFDAPLYMREVALVT